MWHICLSDDQLVIKCQVSECISCKTTFISQENTIKCQLVRDNKNWRHQQMTACMQMLFHQLHAQRKNQCWHDATCVLAMTRAKMQKKTLTKIYKPSNDKHMNHKFPWSPDHKTVIGHFHGCTCLFSIMNNNCHCMSFFGSAIFNVLKLQNLNDSFLLF